MALALAEPVQRNKVGWEWLSEGGVAVPRAVYSVKVLGNEAVPWKCVARATELRVQRDNRVGCRARTHGVEELFYLRDS